MKKLSDYTGDKAIELWADLLDPITAILGDKKIAVAVQTGKPKIEIAKAILKNHTKEATEILLRIDDTPINGINILIRLMALLSDVGENEEIKDFFGYAEQANKEEESSGSVMENTEDEEN